MNLIFEPLHEDATAVMRDAQRPLAVMIRSKENRRRWGLYLDIDDNGDGVEEIASGTLFTVKQAAVRKFCTCGECPEGARK
jgi:hypothetical protein